MQRYRLLRRVCQQCGIRLEAVDYDLSEDYAIRVENVLEFVPVVKYAFTPKVDEMVGGVLLVFALCDVNGVIVI
ncbi:hypothetical protein BLSTO_06352 [Blastocystis sp. subtype 1]